MPTLAGDILQRERFPFVSWARANGFHYPEWAEPVLQECGSAAQAFLVRAFLERPGATLAGTRGVLAGEMLVKVHVPYRLTRLDAVVRRRHVRFVLAVDLNCALAGHASDEALEAAYLRYRRLLRDGYAIAPFSAREVFRDPTECWRQIDAVFAAWELELPPAVAEDTFDLAAGAR